MGPHIFLLFVGLTISLGDAALQPAPCDKSRKVFTEGWGVITDGPFGSNYTQDSHCEWLIKANNTHKYITLSFQSMGTECSYDYVFVYDGDSFSAPLLGSFSGKTDPQNITASSGSMLILLYSDTNYVLDGFRAEYSVTSCPSNCTHQSQGMCVVNTCVCEGDWGGKDCARRLCPEDCGATQGRGSCHLGHCRCSPGYSGQSCSLHRMDPSGNRWHWLSHSESGLSPRSAHTAVYHDETDSLYVFGGYNLNQVLGDLSVYRFETSRWEDEKGVLLDDDSSTLVPLDPHILATVLGQVGVAGEERWGLHKSSFFRNLLFSIADNSTLSIRHQVGDSQRPSARTNREAVGGRRRPREVPQSQEEQTLDSSSEETHTSRDDPRPSEGPMEDTQEPDSDVQDINRSETIPKDELVVEVRNQTIDEDTEHDSDRLTGEEAIPKARYGHAACSYLGGFVLYGGKLSDGTLSDELWYYNATARSWALRALNSPIRPPRLTRHTLTRVGPSDGWLYLFGGSTTGGDFSSRLFRIRLDLDPVLNPREERWTEVHPRGGKELDMRVVAHTTVYHPHTHSLLVYGGVVAGVARFSKLSDRMFSFQLGSKHWAEIHYPRAHLRDTYVPRERAFHTSTVIGNYLVVFGGYSHRHNKEEICYDNQMYLYHLGCQTWISHDILSTAGKDYRYPKQQGVFAHAADVRNGNTLLIVGGYHGNVNSDLLAYTLPPMLAGRTGDSLEPEQICGRHHSLMECTANPECGWCSADEVCYGRTVGINCTTNLQTTRCPGVCPALGDCHSCLIHGNTTTPGGAPSVAYKLRLGHCTWCVQNARCHHRDDNYGVCGLREDTPSQVPGWWGAKGTEVGAVEECRVLDRRPGLTFLKYKHPADLTHPDSVTIINATTVDFSLLNPTTRIEQALVGGMTARLLGFLRPPESWGDTGEILRMCASHSSALLRLASTDNNNNNMDVVGNLTAELSQCLPARLPSGSPVFLVPGRYLVDFESHSSPSKSSYSTHHQSNMELQHYRDNDASKVFTFEYLEPYENGSCALYSNCLQCLTDSMCGWCDLTSLCYSRLLDETEVCSRDDEWRYLTLLPATCANCSNYISCETCVGSGLCEWWTEDAKCARKGRSTEAVLSLRECPAPCHLRGNCSQCLDDRGRCVWCEATQECFSFSIYTSEYQFGLCREWLDQAQNNNHHLQQSLVRGTQQCKSCSSHANCSSCLHTLGCGWCYSVGNPIEGSCVQGDFNKPHHDACSAVVHPSNNSATNWAYAQCPDVDECDLGLHDCHADAVCTNTNGSYSCQCSRGFIGDGKFTCTKTCYNNCINGYCVGAPDYSCKCDLGWTGVDCGLNCGCYNHSTCSQGVGLCDECENWTTGKFCEDCRPGSYGNATSGQGCHGCNCNEHGNESAGICDRDSGLCFCQDNTEGDNCDRCKKGYYGDPRNGGMCYYQCVARGMLTGLEPQGLGSRLGQLTPWEIRPGVPPTRECLWIISPQSNKSADSSGSVVQFTIHKDINVSCQENSVYVYDGLPAFVSTSNIHQSHVLGVYCSQDTKYPVTVEAKSGVLTVFYKQGEPSEGFNASYTILTCPDKCPSNHTCRHGQCVCDEGRMGQDCGYIMCPGNCSSETAQGVCDKGYGRCLCAPGYGAEDCSVHLKPNQLVFNQLFNSGHLADSLDHLRNQLPRLGHSLVADRRGSLWMFGGLSLTHGPLNDIRLFDTKNNTWMQVTVDSTREANEPNMPQGRYFHAAEIAHSRGEIYVYGGLTEKEEVIGLSNNTLSDFWKFNLKNQRWIDIQDSNKKAPPPLAGHTLTLRLSAESESLVLIGGFSPRYGFLETVWEFDLNTDTWHIITTKGNGPLGVYGHSTVYHAPSRSFYVFGGYMYSVNHTFISDKLYALHYPSQFWSVLPSFQEYNPVKHHLPRARFLHSAVTTDEYMLVFGGRSFPRNTTDSLIAYIYSCNQWVRLISRDVDIVGRPPPPTYAHAMTLDIESGEVYVIGGFDGGTQCHVTRISLPRDLCGLWRSKERCFQLPGCSLCTLMAESGNTTFCFNNQRGHSDRSCESDTKSINNNILCNAEWLAGRKCAEYGTCSECLARWPSYFEEGQVCKWCNNCPRGKCVPSSSDCDYENKCSVRQRDIVEVGHCPERQCPASDCDKCLTLGSCVWTRQVLLTPELSVKVTGEPVYDWNCVGDDIPERSSIKMKSMPPMVCPARCSEHQDCQNCLQTPGSEGGWHECRWSVQLNECMSPSYQPLYCAGGVCGLVLRGGNIDRCPEKCATYKQCSICLKHAHCGWCSLDDGNSTGRGVCTEGSLDSPTGGPSHSTCDLLFYLQESSLSGNSSAGSNSTAVSFNSSSRKPVFSWHYVHCPPENECLNNHHTCDNRSEECVDLTEGFQCVCGQGYKSEKNQCVPVCSQGCVRGSCVEPDVCRCNFGYVGANCSIQCQCNGHANCAGPDKLDQCLECHNNTKGSQCEKCKPLFVGDPTNNGQCVPCVDYCNGHTHVCINDSITSFPFSSVSSDISLDELEQYLGEGPTTSARCIGCSNRTTGDKCEECITGNFRGVEDHREHCRPCECHGHGDTCDPVTGENCNCQNNTESNSSCQSSGTSSSKNSNQQCWKMQCSKCRDSYMGTPTGGHQCYRQMTVDSKFCFDAKQLEECKMKPKPLYPGQTAFFVVQPRFMNVDIRVIVDVTQGALDLFLSPRDDTFVVNINSSTGAQVVDMDPRYHWRDDEYHDFSGGAAVRLNSVELLPPGTDTANGTDHSHWSQQVFVVMEREGRGLTTFVTVNQKSTFLLVRGLRDRLVLTLPQDRHDLQATRFYLALTATGAGPEESLTRPSYGVVFFRQDQLHIDLFVFFSVFFSCFFLFLAACVVAWKAKQAADVRRARRRHVVEMLHMAKRPFASVTLVLDSSGAVTPPSTQSPHRKKRKQQYLTGVGEVRPVAIEPTDDGVAAVETVFVRLPGGSEAPVQLALASSLILLARVYPLNGRAFLRRRSSHAPS